MKFLKTVFFVLLTIFVTSVYAKKPGAEPLLVLDMKNTSTYPKNFRTTSDTLPTYPGKNIICLADLHAVGSAQFSIRALEKVLERLRTTKVMIVDLRQESHGFLNGNAVSWFAAGNAGNKGKSTRQIEEEQAKLLHGLAAQKSVTVYKMLTRNEDDEIISSQPIEYAVHEVVSEEAAATALHLSYARMYVLDHHAPSAKNVDRFIEIVKALPKDTWLYFHCRGGAGRTTTFMAMYDMLRNAKNVSFDEIMQRQIALSGKDIVKLPPTTSLRYKPAVVRLEFLKKFYEYANKNQDDFATSWSAFSDKGCTQYDCSKDKKNTTT